MSLEESVLSDLRSMTYCHYMNNAINQKLPTDCSASIESEWLWCISMGLSFCLSKMSRKSLNRSRNLVKALSWKRLCSSSRKVQEGCAEPRDTFPNRPTTFALIWTLAWSESFKSVSSSWSWLYRVSIWPRIKIDVSMWWSACKIFQKNTKRAKCKHNFIKYKQRLQTCGAVFLKLVLNRYQVLSGPWSLSKSFVE